MDKLGKYELVAELARGGMGVVWLAEVRGPGRFVKSCVVKELLPELAKDARHRAMFLDEARIAARLSHRNIVQTNDVGDDGGRLFLAMERLDGTTLRAARARMPRHAFPPALAAHVVAEVLAGLDAAHEARDEDGLALSVVHRDVSASNVFLGFDGQVKIIDFGVAKTREACRNDRTREGFVKGSVAAMSPDHVATAPIDRRADVFSAGVLLRELVTGERVWGEAEDAAILRRLVACDIPAFPAASGAPAGLRAICERAMSVERTDRFATARAMRDAILAWATAAGSPASAEDVARLFDGPLAEERVRARDLDKRAARAARTERRDDDEVIELPSTDLVTMELPRPRGRVLDALFAKGANGNRRRDVFVAAMALVASVAALLSIVTFASVTTTARSEAKPVETITVQVKPAPSPPPPPPVRVAASVEDSPEDVRP